VSVIPEPLAPMTNRRDGDSRFLSNGALGIFDGQTLGQHFEARGEYPRNLVEITTASTIFTCLILFFN